MDDYKIKAPEVGPAFDHATSGEVAEKKSRTPPVMEHKLKPPTLAMSPGGSISQEMGWAKSASREVDLPEKKTFRERAAERQGEMGLQREFQQADEKGLAARRAERSAQEREGMER